jgi:hypothetical protein
VPPMLEPKDRPALSREALLALVAELQRQLAELRASNEALRVEIDQLKHDGKRQAAPFSRGTRVPAPSLLDANLALGPSATVKPHPLRRSPSRRWTCR